MATPQPPYSPPNQPPPDYYPPTPPAYYPAPPQGYPAPPKRDKRQWWIIGSLIALFLIAIVAGLIIAVKGLVSTVTNVVQPPRDATTAYFAAVKAHDWDAAYDRLSTRLQATTKPADLEATWLRRERADGTVDRFSAQGTKVNYANGTETATVTGTLYYASGASDLKIVTLVKEGDAWKLTQLP